MITTIEDAVEAMVGLQGAIASVFGPGNISHTLNAFLEDHKIKHPEIHVKDMLTAPMWIEQDAYAGASDEVAQIMRCFNVEHGYLSYVVGLYKTWVKLAQDKRGSLHYTRQRLVVHMGMPFSSDSLRHADGAILLAALFHRVENVFSFASPMPLDHTRFCVLSHYGIKLTPLLTALLTPECSAAYGLSSRAFASSTINCLVKAYLKEEFPDANIAQ